MTGRVEARSPLSPARGEARAQPRDPPGRGGRGHHRHRHLRGYARSAMPMARPGNSPRPPAVEALDRRIVAARPTCATPRRSGRPRCRRGGAGPLDIVSPTPGSARCVVGPGHPGGLAGHHRHQPDRRLEHDGGQRPAPGRGGRRVDHLHQLRGRPQGPALPRPVRGGQARRGRHRPDAWPTSWPEHIRVNTVHPAGVDTPMGPAWTASRRSSARAQLGAIFMNRLPVEVVDPRDISNAVLLLASDEARYVTGAALTVDAGNTIR